MANGLIVKPVQSLCHWGVVNGGCGFVGKPHPSHPFETPHPTVYKTTHVAQKKLMADESSRDEKSVFARWRGWLFIWWYESIQWDFEGSCRVPKVPNGVPNEVHARSTKWMEVEISSNVKFFKLYPKGREVRSLGSIGAFRSLTSQSTARISLACDHTGGVRSQRLIARSHQPDGTGVLTEFLDSSGRK